MERLDNRLECTTTLFVVVGAKRVKSHTSILLVEVKPTVLDKAGKMSKLTSSSLDTLETAQRSSRQYKPSSYINCDEKLRDVALKNHIDTNANTAVFFNQKRMFRILLLFLVQRKKV